MQEARVIEVTKLERFRNGFYYNLKYKTLGEVKEIEWFCEYDNLKKGDVIYI